TLPGFVAGLAAAGLRPDRYNTRAARRWSARGDDEILAALGVHPNMLVARLTPHLAVVDYLVHHQDIRRPLGLGRDAPEPLLRAALDVVVTARQFRAGVDRVANGTRLVALDLDWSHGASGTVVTGTGEALLMALTG